MKSYNKKKTHSSKLNIFLVIAALLVLVITAITVSYSWIESSNALNIQNGTGNTITAKVQSPGVANITAGVGSAVSLSDYIDNKNSLYLAPAKLDSNGNLTIKRDGGTYTDVTTNDIGNNYIEFDVPFKVAATYKFKFTESSSITYGDSAALAPVKVSVALGSDPVKVFDADLKNIDTGVTDDEKATAFIALNSQNVQYLKVRIWLDAEDSNVDSIKGEKININLTLVPEAFSTQDYQVTVKSLPYANIKAINHNTGEQIPLDTATALAPGTKIDLTATTANGILITSGTYANLNGHKFHKFTSTVGSAAAADISGVTTSTNDTDKTLTATVTYTVPVGIGGENITINSFAPADTFRLGGGSINGLEGWSDNNSRVMTYNEDLNCVHTIINASAAPSFKIASGEDFSVTYRDYKEYSVSLNSPTITTSGVTGANIEAENHNFVYTDPIDRDVLVIYYLDSNKVEMTTDTTLKTNYTATAAVSTGDAGGTASVTYGTTTHSTVTVPRRAADKKVTFTAQANEGYRFVGWSTTDGETTYESTQATYVINEISKDTKLYANFTKIHKLTVTNSTGTVTAKDGNGNNITLTNGSAYIDDGTKVVLTATPPDNVNAYKLIWTVDGNAQTPITLKPGETSNHTILSMTAPHEIVVSFERLYKLELTKTGDGSDDPNAVLTLSDNSDNEIALTGGVAYLEKNTTVKVTAKVNATGSSYKVSTDIDLSGPTDLIPTETEDAKTTFAPIQVSADTAVSVEFARLFKVTYSIAEGSVESAVITATISGESAPLSGSPAYVPKDTVLKFAVTPNDSNYLRTWTVTGGTPNNGYGIIPDQTITADTVVTVKVKEIEYQDVTINLPNPTTLATIKYSYTLGSTTVQETVTSTDQTVRIPQGVVLTVKADSLADNAVYNNFTVNGVDSDKVKHDEENKAVKITVGTSPITVTPNITEVSVAACSQDILNGTKVSFYAGYHFTNPTDVVIVAKNSNNATVEPVNKAADYTDINIDNKDYQSVVNVIEVTPQQYYIKQNTLWGGVATVDDPVIGGKFYGVHSVNSGEDTPTSYGPTTATTTASETQVDVDSKDLTVTTNNFSSTKSAIDTDLYVQHYVKGVSDTNYKLLATKKLAATTDSLETSLDAYTSSAGTITVKTVLTDGKVYYVAGTTEIKVGNQSSGVTIYLKNDANWNGTPSVHIWSSGGDDYKTWNVAAEQMTYDSSAQLWTYTLTAEDATKYDRCKFHMGGNNQTENLVFHAGYIYNNQQTSWSEMSSTSSRTFTLNVTGEPASGENDNPKWSIKLANSSSDQIFARIYLQKQSDGTYIGTIPASIPSDFKYYTIERRNPNGYGIWNQLWTGEIVDGNNTKTISRWS